MASKLKPVKEEKQTELSKAIQETEEEEVEVLSDSEFAEDGYVHDVPLLVGYTDKEGILHNTFTFRDMNAKDEEAISKNDVRANQGKVATVTLERCVSEVGSLTKKELGTKEWGKVIRDMCAQDLDFMLLKVREVSKGKEITFTHVCPNCGTQMMTVVGTDEIEITPFSGVTKIPFNLPRGYKDKAGKIHKKGHIRLVNGLDREIIIPVIVKNEAKGKTLMYTRILSFDDGAVVTEDQMGYMSTLDREYLDKIIVENDFGISFKIDVSCSNCGMDLSGVNARTNFF